jgi:hypothetical protein
MRIVDKKYKLAIMNIIFFNEGMCMSEKAVLSIAVKFLNNELYAVAKIISTRPIKQMNFILSNCLTIEKIETEKGVALWNKAGEEKPEFRSLSQRIMVSCEYPAAELSISYHGSIDGYHNIVTNNITTLSWYSVWYPQEIPFDFNDEVIIENSEDLFIVKGFFCPEKKVWQYGGKGYDPFNIIAYKKDVLKIISNEYLNIYFVDPDIEKYAEKAQQVYKDILSFYNGELFERHDLSVLDIACVSPALTTGGGYRRKDFMFCTTLGNDELNLTWLFAHETAHEWCTGADSATWEDWLNETTAEWASLLYALKNGMDDLFHFILDPKFERLGGYPPIKTADGSRPSGVHDKGTILFYTIYQKHGKDVITKMVRGFTLLKTKDTENFITMVEQEIDEEVAEEIREGINLLTLKLPGERVLGY